jgi:hypothetical protein
MYIHICMQIIGQTVYIGVQIKPAYCFPSPPVLGWPKTAPSHHTQVKQDTTGPLYSR